MNIEEEKARRIVDGFEDEEDYPIYIDTFHGYVVRGG